MLRNLRRWLLALILIGDGCHLMRRWAPLHARAAETKSASHSVAACAGQAPQVAHCAHHSISGNDLEGLSFRDCPTVSSTSLWLLRFPGEGVPETPPKGDSRSDADTEVFRVRFPTSPQTRSRLWTLGEEPTPQKVPMLCCCFCLETTRTETRRQFTRFCITTHCQNVLIACCVSSPACGKFFAHMMICHYKSPVTIFESPFCK